MQFGSLSHSHLNQVLKNVAGGVKYDLPSIVGPDGTLHLDLLAARDPAFAEHVRNGLLWEVLASERHFLLSNTVLWLCLEANRGSTRGQSVRKRDVGQSILWHGPVHVV